MFAGLFAAGCSPLGPTASPEIPSNTDLTVENFSGTLAVKGSSFYSFSVAGEGTTYLSLISLKEAGVDSDVLVTIGLGTPRATSCTASNVLSVKATGVLQLTGQTNRGVHCAVVFDPGNLTKAATFSLNIAHPK